MTKINSTKRSVTPKGEKEPAINAQMRLARLLREPKQNRKAASAAHVFNSAPRMPDAAAAAERARAAAVMAERERVASLARLRIQAARIGVEFDAPSAINGGISLPAARTSVLEAAAARDEKLVINSFFSRPPENDENKRMAEGWDEAIEKAHEKR